MNTDVRVELKKKKRRHAKKKGLTTDRVNAIVQQFEEFYKAYGIKHGDGMYLTPEQRFQL